MLKSTAFQISVAKHRIILSFIQPILGPFLSQKVFFEQKIYALWRHIVIKMKTLFVIFLKRLDIIKISTDPSLRYQGLSTQEITKVFDKK